MKLDKQLILEKLSIAAEFVKRFRFILVFTIFSVLYGYILIQVNGIIAKKPSESQISEKATAAPKTKIDPKLAEKITSLEDQNIQIKTIFSDARKNPFAE